MSEELPSRTEWPQHSPHHRRKPASEAVGLYEPMPRTFERRTLRQKLVDAWRRAVDPRGKL